MFFNDNWYEYNCEIKLTLSLALEQQNKQHSMNAFEDVDILQNMTPCINQL